MMRINYMAIKFKIKELILEMEFRERRTVQINEIAGATGIHRVTLSKLANNKRYNPGVDTVDKLCKFFACEVGDVIEYVPEEPVTEEAK